MGKSEAEVVIDREEFETWKQHPITRWVLSALVIEAGSTRDQFLQDFFYTDNCDPFKQGEARGEFFARMGMHPNELTYERIVELHDIDGEQEFTPSGGWIPKAGREQ